MSMFGRTNRMRFDPYGTPTPEVNNAAPDLNSLYGLPPQPATGEIPGLQNPGLLPAPGAPKLDLQNPGLLPGGMAPNPFGVDDEEEGRGKRRPEQFGPYSFN